MGTCSSLAMAPGSLDLAKSAAEQASVATAIPVPSPVAAPNNGQSDTHSDVSDTIEMEGNDAQGSRVSEKGVPRTEDAQDENVVVVGWEGPDDPENPRK